MKAQVLLAALLFTAGLAQADHTADHEKYNTNQQQLSRRPYAATPAAKPEKFEGDIANIEETKAEKNYKTLQLHMLGKRPYADKNTD